MLRRTVSFQFHQVRLPGEVSPGAFMRLPSFNSIRYDYRDETGQPTKNVIDAFNSIRYDYRPALLADTNSVRDTFNSIRYDYRQIGQVFSEAAVQAFNSIRYDYRKRPGPKTLPPSRLSIPAGTITGSRLIPIFTQPELLSIPSGTITGRGARLVGERGIGFQFHQVRLPGPASTATPSRILLSIPSGTITGGAFVVDQTVCVRTFQFHQVRLPVGRGQCG